MRNLLLVEDDRGVVKGSSPRALVDALARAEESARAADAWLALELDTV
jgi:hypothetical protein